MNDVTSKSTIHLLCDDIDAIVDWKADYEARARRAHLCNMSSVGLSDERREELIHEGRCLLRALNGVLKRLSDK
jgi:hypothetical protein